MAVALKHGGLWRRIADNRDPQSLSSRMRQRRIQHVATLIEQVSASRGHVSILDVGGEELYWTPLEKLLQSGNTSITILNLIRRGEDNGPFTHVIGNGCALPYADRSFDIVHSNSVIEHVGGWDEMRAFARETRRVGSAYFVQTPAFGFPLEPHFGLIGFHWLPRSVRIALVQDFACGHFQKCATREDAIELVDSTRLLAGSQMRQLFPDGRMEQERFRGLTKSLMAIRDFR